MVKVFYSDGENEPSIKEFATLDEAVDFIESTSDTIYLVKIVIEKGEN